MLSSLPVSSNRANIISNKAIRYVIHRKAALVWFWWIGLGPCYWCFNLIHEIQSNRSCLPAEHCLIIHTISISFFSRNFAIFQLNSNYLQYSGQKWLHYADQWTLKSVYVYHIFFSFYLLLWWPTCYQLFWISSWMLNTNTPSTKIKTECTGNLYTSIYRHNPSIINISSMSHHFMFHNMQSTVRELMEWAKGMVHVFIWCMCSCWWRKFTLELNWNSLKNITL